MMRRIAALIVVLSLPTAALAADIIVLENVKTEWQNLYGAIVYAASATAHNTGSVPVKAVKVRLSLYDKDGKLVIERNGFNLSAEQLEEHAEAIDTVKPIPPGGTDPIRISIDKADIGKPFRTATLTVVEAK
jgi:hypothetical protein